jgi:putative CocE/NonD family hydrolase
MRVLQRLQPATKYALAMKREERANPNHPVAFDQDVDVPMRDGALLKADVFRPYGDGKYPAILNLGPYQKDKLWIVPDTLGEPGNEWMNWETVNPKWWVPRGYAAVRVDGRGTGKSPGQCEPWSFAEAVDFYDAIEWAAAQPWCNGHVGLLGISYFAINQWFVANLAPPSLKAIIPWEGFADLYRDALFHGGILNLFMTNWFTAHLLHHLLGRASQHQPDGWQVNTLHFWLRNNLDSGAFRGAQAQWDKINVPMFSVGNWSGMALHLRGNTEAFMRAATPHKKLRIHLGSHVHPFYTDDGREDQIRFFDYWLKGIDNGVMDEPPVKLQIRKGADTFEWRQEHEWPLKRTRWTKLYLDLSQPQATPPTGTPLTGALEVKNPQKADSRSYPASSLGTMGSTSAASSQVMGGGIKPGMGVSLETAKLSVDTEITGPLAAVLWVSSTTEDMDLFLTLRNIGPDGNEIMETGQQGAPVPVAKGWLRVSHRELDPQLSLPYRPYHKHVRRLYLTPGEIVKVEVEIWPTSMVFKKGHRIRLDVQPRDGVGSAQYMHYHADYNSGAINTIHAGGDKESYLLLPVIPAAEG